MHGHLRLINTFKDYNTVRNACGSVPNVWGIIDKLVTQDLQS